MPNPGRQLVDDVSCPAESQCTFAGTTGDEVTFDPLTGQSSTPLRVESHPGGTDLGVTCPSVHQCTALGSSHTAVTFDPQNPARMFRRRLGSGFGSTPLALGEALACPGARQCTAINEISETTFDPQ